MKKILCLLLAVSANVYAEDAMNEIKTGTFMTIIVPKGTVINNNCEFSGKLYAPVISFNEKTTFYKAGDTINLKCEKPNNKYTFIEVNDPKYGDKFSSGYNAALSINDNFMARMNVIVNNNQKFNESEFIYMLYTGNKTESGNNINYVKSGKNVNFEVKNNNVVKVEKVVDYKNTVVFTLDKFYSNLNIVETYENLKKVRLDFVYSGNQLIVQKSPSGKYQFSYINAETEGIDSGKHTFITVEELK